MKWTLLKWSDDSGPFSPDNKVFREYLIGKRLRVGYSDRGAFRQIEGVVSKANLLAILLDMGKNSIVQYIEWDWINQADEVPEVIRSTRIIVRKLGVVDEQTVRQHLADRHGVIVNSIPASPAEAMMMHAAQHVGELLAHVHPARGGTLTADEIAARTEELDAEYENAFECDSCGYVRLPEEDGRQFRTFERNDEEFKHCEECWDMKEFQYL